MRASLSTLNLNRRTLVFLIGMALTQLSVSMSLIQIPVYIRELGASISEIGIFFTVSMIFPLLLRVFGGWLADSLGRLRVIFLGSLTGVLTYIVYAVAPSWEAALLAPALMAVTTSLTLPAYLAHLADIAPAHSRGRMYGASQTVYRIAGVVGPPLGGLLGASFGYRVMFGASTLVFATSAVIFFVLLRGGTALPKPDQQFSFKAFRSSMGELGTLFLAGGVVTWILLIDGVRDIAFQLSFDLMPVYLTDVAEISKEGIGLLFGIYGIAPLLVLYPAGLLVDRTSERAVIAAALTCVVSSRLVFALAGNFWGFALSWFLLGVGASLFEPSGGSLIARVVPRHLRGTFFGLFATTLSIFSLPAPWIGSQIWNLLGPRYPFLITVALGSLTILPAWFKLYAPRREAAAPARRPKPDWVTVLSLQLPAGAPASWRQAAEQIVGQHRGVLNRSDDSTLSACFGVAPFRAPPQVSALLATHAALSIAEHLQRSGPASTASLGMGVSTGPASVQLAAGQPAEDPPDLGDVLRAAQVLRHHSRGAGLLISGSTHSYLEAARDQFEFGRSGPLKLPGVEGVPTAYQVTGRRGPLNWDDAYPGWDTSG